MLRYPDGLAQGADVTQAGSAGSETVPVPGWPLAAVLAGRGITPVSYAEWLRIETAETDLAKALGRGERVKLHNAAAIWSACRPIEE
jgi:ferredoxin--NADP+ reductase